MRTREVIAGIGRTIMDDGIARLKAWCPGLPGYSRDEMILAVGFQCRGQCFPVSDVLNWLGAPDKAIGDSAAGQIAYFYSEEAEAAPVFSVADGKVVYFGVISRFIDNTKRVDPVTGKETCFNIFDRMTPFDASMFK